MEKYTCPKCKGATLALVKGDISKTLEIVKKHHKGLKLHRRRAENTRRPS